MLTPNQLSCVWWQGRHELWNPSRYFSPASPGRGSRGIQWWWCSDSLSKLRTWLETCWPLSLPASSLHFRCTATAQFFFFYFLFIFGWVAKTCRYFTGLKVTEEVTIGGCSKYPCSSLVDLLTRTWEAQKDKTQSHPSRLSLPVVHCGKLA